MNQEAAALAADSAVTIGGGNAPKIYPSANKIFTLSKYNPVGIMVFGNARFLDVHWETAIKIFRDGLGESCFDSLEEYGERFLEFIEESRHLFPGDQQEKFNKQRICQIYSEIVERFIPEYLSLSKSGSPPNSRTIEELLNAIAASNYGWIDNSEDMRFRDGQIPDASFFRKVEDEYSGIIKEALAETIPDWIPLSDSSAERLTSLAQAALRKENPQGISSGIVIAGYGENDIFPRLISYSLETIVCNRLKFHTAIETGITFERHSAILPFAQTDMVHAFVEGIDREYNLVLNQKISDVFRVLSETIGFKILNFQEDNPLMTEIRSSMENAYRNLDRELREIRQKRYVSPLFGIVAALPKTELAAMAETLVGITSFKKKLSDTAETVGGPIDVCLISKGDGFVWIKRKHYFEKEYNEQFMINYFRRGINGK